MSTAYLSLGSNLGDREQNIRRSYALLAQAGLRMCAISKIYETQSVEGGGADDFLNAALRIETELSARELLKICQSVETAIGREPSSASGVHRGGARLIDLDILLFGDEQWDELDLQIPHPRMLHRAFVLRPLCDVLEGGWVREFTNELG